MISWRTSFNLDPLRGWRGWTGRPARSTQLDGTCSSSFLHSSIAHNTFAHLRRFIVVVVTASFLLPPIQSGRAATARGAQPICRPPPRLALPLCSVDRPLRPRRTKALQGGPKLRLDSAQCEAYCCCLHPCSCSAPALLLLTQPHRHPAHLHHQQHSQQFPQSSSDLSDRQPCQTSSPARTPRSSQQ